LAECSGSASEIRRYLEVLRYCAGRYREAGGVQVTLSPADFARDLGLNEQEARRVSILLMDGRVRLWTAATGADNDPRSFTLGVFSRRLAQVASLEEVFNIVDADEGDKRAAALSAQRQLPVPFSNRGKIFLSHAAADHDLAVFVRTALSGNEVFMASKAGDIRPGDDWLLAIQAELKAASAYVVLLTPNSVDRPWVSFEGGAAWMSERRLVFVVAGGLRVEEVPYPLAAFQILSLERPDHVRAVFEELGIPISDPGGFADAITKTGISLREAKDEADGWQGVQVEDRFYAWRGALDGLEDREPDFADKALYAALQGAGMKPFHGARPKLSRLISEGWAPVYLTDRRRWRRAVLGNNDLILVVRQAT
jgi:hypothetical protein